MTRDKYWMLEAAKCAQGALCARDKCGAVLVNSGQIIGRGYNAPPQDNLKHAKCSLEYGKDQRKPKADRTCCMHAEWRAILEALRKYPKKLIGSTLYFVRINEKGEPKFSGEPYCTHCSRLALDVGIAKFALWRQDGVKLYNTADYNNLSYDFHSKKKLDA